MNKVILFSLLVTSTVINCKFDVDLHVKNLSEIQLKKVQELSVLSKQIAEKQAFIESFNLKVYDTIGSIETLNPELEEYFSNFIQKFENAFNEKKDVKNILTGSFDEAGNSEFNYIKLLIVMYHFERLLLKNLVGRYEKCLQDFIEIDNK